MEKSLEMSVSLRLRSPELFPCLDFFGDQCCASFRVFLAQLFLFAFVRLPKIHLQEVRVGQQRLALRFVPKIVQRDAVLGVVQTLARTTSSVTSRRAGSSITVC